MLFYERYLKGENTLNILYYKKDNLNAWSIAGKMCHYYIGARSICGETSTKFQAYVWLDINEIQTDMSYSKENDWKNALQVIYKVEMTKAFYEKLVKIRHWGNKVQVKCRI